MRVIKDEQIFKHPFASLSKKTIESDSGIVHSHLVIEKKDAVCLTLFDTHTKKLLFVKQFRAGAHYNTSLNNSFTVEPIAGHIDPGESPIQSALREALEETTIEIDESKIELFAKGLTSPGISNEIHYHLIATFDSSLLNMNSILNSVHGIDDEEIQIVMYSIKEAMEMISTGEIFASHSIIGIMKAAITFGA